MKKIITILTAALLLCHAALAQDSDDDNDGVPNSQDECPTVYGTASNKGCPEKQGDETVKKQDINNTKKTTTQTPGQNKWYDLYAFEDVKMDSTNEQFTIEGVSRYNKSYTLNLAKGEHFFIKLNSLDDVKVILFNVNTNVKSALQNLSSIVGTTIQTGFVVPDSAKYLLYVVNMSKYKRISYDLYMCLDRLYLNNHIVDLPLCEKLKIVQDYKKISYTPLATGSLLSTEDNGLYPHKIFATNFELFEGLNLNITVPKNFKCDLYGNIDSSSNLAAIKQKMKSLKNKIAACYADSKKFNVKEGNNEFNDNLPDVHFYLKESEYKDTKLFRLDIMYNKEKKLYYLTFRAYD